MSADYESEHFKVYAHTDMGFLAFNWRDGPPLGNLSAGQLRELDEIRRQWLADNPDLPVATVLPRRVPSQIKPPWQTPVAAT